jgi:hypothetical protein
MICTEFTRWLEQVEFAAFRIISMYCQFSTAAWVTALEHFRSEGKFSWRNGGRTAGGDSAVYEIGVENLHMSRTRTGVRALQRR